MNNPLTPKKIQRLMHLAEDRLPTMDNPLTPKKIQRLMHLAEDKTFSVSKFMDRNATWAQSSCPSSLSMPSQSEMNYESSGILDLDHMEGFGDSGNNMSLAQSATFTVNEMTGRSTEAEDPVSPSPTTHLNVAGPSKRRSLSPTSIDMLAQKMHQQSMDVKKLMRQSIASMNSFHSRNLSADETSFIKPMPLNPAQIFPKFDSTRLDADTSEQSIGSYFHKNNPEFCKIFQSHTESPKYDVSSIYTAGSSQSSVNKAVKDSTQVCSVEDSLDDVPTRQPRQLTLSEKPPPTSVHQHSAYVPMTDVIAEPPVLTVTNATMMNCTVNQSGVRNKALMDPKKRYLLAQVSEESNRSEEQDSSLSLSKIMNIMRSESAINVTDMLEHIDNQKKERRSKPLHEIDTNTEPNKLSQNQTTSSRVTTLKESKKSETASSASSVNTIINNSKYRLCEQENVPQGTNVPQVIEKHNVTRSDSPVLNCPRARSRSKSPSCRPTQPLNAVAEKYLTSSATKNSQATYLLDENTSDYYGYKELDKSVNWHEILDQKGVTNYQSIAKDSEEHVKISVAHVQGFVGGSSSGVIHIESLLESWLITRFEFNDLSNQALDLSIDLPKFPILLTTEKAEEMTIKLASNVEMNAVLQFTVLMKDPSMECDVRVKGSLPVEFKMPVIQAISASGINKLIFPTIAERQTYAKRLLLISECPVDLQLELSIVGSTHFFVNNIQEIEMTEGMVRLLDTKPDDRQTKSKPKGMSRTLCRLSNGKALRVSVIFSEPTLNSQQASHCESFTGELLVKLIGINALLRKVELTATVGRAKLELDVQTDHIKLTNHGITTPITFRNAGTVSGKWFLKFAEPHLLAYFEISLNQVQLAGGAQGQLEVKYVGPDNKVMHGTLIFEEITGNDIVTLQITGGIEKPKTFPIKTNCNSMSWVRPGRKEISLKNYTDSRVHLKCGITGEGFALDAPTSSQNLLLTFGPCECRPLYIIFNSKSGTPRKATLHLVYESDTEISRKIILYGCASGDSVSWRGIVTSGDTALIRAVTRTPVLVPLTNKAKFPSFFAATVQFSLQHQSAAPRSHLAASRRILAARSHHTVTLHVDWPRVEKKVASAGAAGNNTLATIVILTGAEFTRLRILKILKNCEVSAAEIPLPGQFLELMAGPFDGEMPELGNLLEDFNEPKSALKELANGLTELKVHIDLTEDFVEDNTIMITDDTVLDYHTICD